jgi:hypothetical protein
MWSPRKVLDVGMGLALDVLVAVSELVAVVVGVVATTLSPASGALR